MLINSSGNVGIGTITPTAKLEVNGNVIAATPTAANHLATKAYVDSAVSAAGGSLKVYKYDGSTVIGNFLSLSSTEINYSQSDGTIGLITQDHRSNSWATTYYYTANCTGTAYAQANYDWNSGVSIGSPWYARNDGNFYNYTLYNNSITWRTGFASAWT